MIRYLDLLTGDGHYASEIARHSGDEVRVYKNVDNEKLQIALYYPPEYNHAQKYPLVTFIHGGGWQSRKIFKGENGWAGDYLGFLARYFADRGYLCASIDYRLMRNDGQESGYELIDLCDDCREAVNYLKQNTTLLGIDAERTAVLGESAGGYLAAALVTLPWMDTNFFKTAIIVNGITDLTDPRWETRLKADSNHPRLQRMSVAEQKMMMSPVFHIGKDTVPTLLIHGMDDRVVLPYHSHEFHDLLSASGQQAELDLICNTTHAFLLAEYMLEQGRPLEALSISVERISQWLIEQGVK